MMHMPRLKPAALATVLAFATLPQLVHAAQTYGSFTLDAQYILGTSSSTTMTDGLSASNTTVYANGADFLGGYTDSTGNSVFFHTYGADFGTGGYFGARVSGEGTFMAMTSVRRSTTVTNTSGVAQAASYQFYVDSGELGFWGSGTGMSDLLLRIAVNGTVVAADHTSVVMSASGVTCSSNDLGVLGGYMNCGAGSMMSANAANYVLNLGILNAGESLTLDYDIISAVSGNMVGGTTTREQFVCDVWEDSYGGYGGDVGAGGVGVQVFAALAAVVEGDGGGATELPYGCKDGHTETITVSDVTGGSISRSGDPDVLSLLPLPVLALNNVNAVPEPGSMALLGLGLAGLAAVRRRVAKA